MREISEVARGRAAAPQEVTVETFFVSAGADAREVRRVKFKLADKLGALRDLGRHRKLFTDKAEIEGRITLEQLIAESYPKDKAAK
jgi:phage terminase small subunit